MTTSAAAPATRKVWNDKTADTVTSRQEQVLRLKRKGLSNSAIAENLGIGVATVKAHVQNAGRRIRPPKLSERQKQVVREAAAGLSDKEIGAKLGISGKTVSAHLMTAYLILGVNTRGELAYLLERQGGL